MNNLLMDIRNQMFSELHIHAKVIYVLKNESDEIRALACDADEPFHLFGITGRMNGRLFINSVPDWDFNIDTYLFEDMEEGFDIAYILQKHCISKQYMINKIRFSAFAKRNICMMFILH